MSNRILLSIVAIMAVACFAIIAESDTTTTPDQAIDLPAPVDLAIVTPTPPNPDDWQIVSTGPNLAGGAYLDCPTYGYRGGYYRNRCDCSCQCGPLGRVQHCTGRWFPGKMVLRVISAPFRRRCR